MGSIEREYAGIRSQIKGSYMERPALEVFWDILAKAGYERPVADVAKTDFEQMMIERLIAIAARPVKKARGLSSEEWKSYRAQFARDVERSRDVDPRIVVNC